METPIAQAQALTTVLSVFAFVLGSMVGSFLNVCVYRIPKGESVVKPRSRCPKCGNTIAWYDNVPILSWLMLGAKCRHCGVVISWQYALVEALTGTLFFLVFWRFGVQVATPVYMALAASLVLVTFVDLTDWTIPNEVTLPGIPIGIALSVVATFYPASGLHVMGPFIPVFDSLLGVVAGGAMLYFLDKAALVLLKKRGMGLGDVKLLAMLGAFFGLGGVLLIIVLAAFVGSIGGVAQILITRGKEVSDEEPTDDEHGPPAQGHYLPFGPYLALAGLIAMFFGPEIVSAYFTYLGAGVS